ncbi:hypothetical protein ABPG75_003285 [Micractinium tetrahymenae]
MQQCFVRHHRCGCSVLCNTIAAAAASRQVKFRARCLRLWCPLPCRLTHTCFSCTCSPGGSARAVAYVLYRAAVAGAAADHAGGAAHAHLHDVGRLLCSCRPASTAGTPADLHRAAEAALNAVISHRPIALRAALTDGAAARSGSAASDRQRGGWWAAAAGEAVRSEKRRGVDAGALQAARPLASLFCCPKVSVLAARGSSTAQST